MAFLGGLDDILVESYLYLLEENWAAGNVLLFHVQSFTEKQKEQLKWNTERF